MEFTIKRRKLYEVFNDISMTIFIPKGAVVLLLGSKDKVPEMPQTPVKFIEDMNDAEAATAVLPFTFKSIKS